MKNKIIIIEDEPLLLQALNIELLDAGFDVLSSLNGEAGFKLIQKEMPQLILLDLLLPGISGFEVLALLRQDEVLKKIPVVILSNLGQQEEQKHVLELGVVDYFIKSNTDLAELTKKIKTILPQK